MGIFITFEGPDGSGKTTLTTRLHHYLEEKKVATLLTREPGGIEISEKIRTIILNPAHANMDDRTEALLYAASRRQHLIEKIIPALDANKIVLCDRFIDSSLAYQGYARNIGIQDVLDINMFAIENYMPDVTLFLDVSPEIGLARVGNRGEKDRLELAGDAFHNRVYQGYLEVLKMYPNRIRIIDGNQSEDAVFEAAKAIVDEEILKYEASKG